MIFLVDHNLEALPYSGFYPNEVHKTFCLFPLPTLLPAPCSLLPFKQNTLKLYFGCYTWHTVTLLSRK